MKLIQVYASNTTLKASTLPLISFICLTSNTTLYSAKHCGMYDLCLLKFSLKSQICYFTDFKFGTLIHNSCSDLNFLKDQLSLVHKQICENRQQEIMSLYMFYAEVVEDEVLHHLPM